MSEQKPEAQPEGAGDVPVEAPKDQTTSQRFTDTMADAKAKLADNAVTENLPEELQGMDQASLEKYYKDGVFDWASYGKEQAFKAKQSPASEEPAKAEEGEGEPKEGITDEEADKAKEIADHAGVDFDAAANDIIENGDISEADRKKLLDNGIPEIVIDEFVRLLVTDVNARVTSVIESLGGEEHFNAVFDGLQEKATPEQRDNIDDLLRDPATFDAGIQLAKSLSGVTTPEPSPNEQITGGRNQVAPTAPAVQGFASFDEQMIAQRDPRYTSDPVYRDEVMKRIQASTYTVNPRAHTGGL